MKSDNHKSSAAVERLTALWALNEAGLGGISHGLSLPFTGITIGGIAIILICLIAYFAEKKSAAIFKATIIVLIIKAAVSPHTPLPAYIAVSAQGILGAAIFGLIPNFRIGALLLGTLALFEITVQKFLQITLLYGNSFWEAIDLFYEYALNKLMLSPGSISGSHLVIGLYVGLYVTSGIIVGWFAGILPPKISEAMKDTNSLKSILQKIDLEKSPDKIFRKSSRRKLVIVIALLIFLIAVLFFLSPGESGFSKALYVFLRVALVSLIWFFVVGPIVRKIFHEFIHKKRRLFSKEVDDILILFPSIKSAVKILWKEYAEFGKLARIKNTIFTLIVFALVYENKNLENQTNNF